MKYEVSVIVPIYNSESTLRKTLDSLEKQTYPISKVFLVNNKSKDNSSVIMSQYKCTSQHNVVIINHEEDFGLAYSYNECIKLAASELIVTLHSDIVICEDNGIEELVKPFKKSEHVVATYPLVEFPIEQWKKYNFWQKCIFSRHLHKLHPGCNGMFNCFNKSALIKIGLFDDETFRSAGEDGDIYNKLQKIGTTLLVNTKVEHLHYIGNNFSINDYIYKENQYAEAAGAGLRKNLKTTSYRNIFFINIRPLLILSLIIPHLRIFSILFLIMYSFFITKNVFLSEWKNLRILILPFINILSLFGYTYYYLKGFLTAKQRL